MEKVSCYNCLSESSKFFISENGFTLVKCSQCGLLYVNPRPSEDEISAAAISGMHKGDETINVSDQYRTEKALSYESRIKDLYKDELNNKKIALFDLGCGYGEFIEAIGKFVAKDSTLVGSEPSEVKKASAIKRGLNVDFYDISNLKPEYDIISVLNVFSHLPNPPKFFETLKKGLKPGGEFLIQTGDSSGLTPHTHHKPFLLPDHLSFASEEIVCNILKKIGFEIITVQRYEYYPKMHFKYNMVWDLKDRIKSIVKPGHKRVVHPEHDYRFFNMNLKRDMYIRAKMIS
ncbi:MAG: class I SAM-dependent methyltransferase [Bacteroidetes bacterium]|nr:class I SAM-dependent methyltransferase [Bacteroidota bacterium]